MKYKGIFSGNECRRILGSCEIIGAGHGQGLAKDNPAIPSMKLLHETSAFEQIALLCILSYSITTVRSRDSAGIDSNYEHFAIFSSIFSPARFAKNKAIDPGTADGANKWSMVCDSEFPRGVQAGSRSPTRKSFSSVGMEAGDSTS